jgi:hypothetical protein
VERDEAKAAARHASLSGIPRCADIRDVPLGVGDATALTANFVGQFSFDDDNVLAWASVDSPADGPVPRAHLAAFPRN